MSESSPEPVRVSPPAPTRGGNVLTRKYGPLPGWGWAVLAGGGYVLYRWWSGRSSSSATTAATSTTSGTSGTGVDYGPQIATLQAEIQQLQGSQSSGGGTGGGGNPPPAERYVRRVSTGRQSLAQIAKARNEKPPAIYRVSKASGKESAGNLAKLAKWEKRPSARRKGVVYYTEH